MITRLMLKVGIKENVSFLINSGIDGIMLIGNTVSMSISGPTERFTEQKIPIFISLAKEPAIKISVLLGY